MFVWVAVWGSLIIARTATQKLPSKLVLLRLMRHRSLPESSWVFSVTMATVLIDIAHVLNTRSTKKVCPGLPNCSRSVVVNHCYLPGLLYSHKTATYMTGSKRTTKPGA